MASSKTEGGSPKTMTHRFTTGAALMLKNALTSRGWYKDEDYGVLLAAVDVQQNHFADLKDPQPEEGEDQRDYDRRVEPLHATVVMVELTQAEREACQICAAWVLKQGGWPLNQHTANIIRELELKK